ncbi:hypothetical protein Pan189_11760 [Stratiformator vulcanicus]|uniref:Uncharacterized protein n=1 Tax=Stratiformator vulcanicus TaxID=2527980 RepID=A0A517QYZ4_9PLAN|nr:hypothetical protein Pan189_11760 [Stratiformator vulcanicus]
MHRADRLVAKVESTSSDAMLLHSGAGSHMIKGHRPFAWNVPIDEFTSSARRFSHDLPDVQPNPFRRRSYALLARVAVRVVRCHRG